MKYGVDIGVLFEDKCCDMPFISAVKYTIKFKVKSFVAADQCECVCVCA